MQSLRGKVAIITGASSGIGAEIAQYFAKHGALLSLAGRKQDNLHDIASRTELADRNILTTVGDIVRDGDRSRLINRTMDKFGKLDILINNAGIVQFGPMNEITEEGYDEIFNINLKAHVFLTKLAIPQLLITKGNIVNISSASSSMLARAYGAYSMTKIALDAYTKVLAAELGPGGVRVNAVNSGFVPSNILKRSNVDNPEKVAQILSQRSSLRRAGTPEEIAKAAAFLASDLASFVTGELLYADGGLRLRD